MKLFIQKLKLLMEDIVPKVEFEEMAMFYKGTMLIPVCGMSELGDHEIPDGVSIFRKVKWLGSEFFVRQVSETYVMIRQERYSGKEKENKSKE